MNPRLISFTAIALAILTALWVVILIPQLNSYGGAIDSYDKAISYISKGGALFYITYLNAVLLTIINIVLFGLLYLFFRESRPVGSLIGILFIPVYASYNLFVYISQVSILLKMLDIYDGTVNPEILEVVLGLMVQMYENSAVSFLNNYAYAVLGIPSILFGCMMYRLNITGKITGVLLILNGIACLLGITGVILGNGLLSNGSVIGGVIFLLSLPGMIILFWNIDS